MQLLSLLLITVISLIPLDENVALLIFSVIQGSGDTLFLNSLINYKLTL